MKPAVVYCLDDASAAQAEALAGEFGLPLVAACGTDVRSSKERLRFFQAQLEQLPGFLAVKRKIAERYADFCAEHGVEFVREPENARSNYWLNAIILADRSERDAFLKATNDQGVMTRPIWRLMSELPMYGGCQRDGLGVSRWLEERVVNLPSSVP